MSRRSISNLQPPSTAHTTYSHFAPLSASKTLTLWIHDPDAGNSISKLDAVLNYDLFPPGVARPGDIAEVKLLTHSSGGNVSSEGYSSGNNLGSDAGVGDVGVGGEHMERRTSYTNSAAAEPVGADERSTELPKPEQKEGGKFLFVIRELDETVKRKQPNIQLSLANHVATLFGFHSRATVVVTIVDKSLHEASHVEIFFRDQYLTRSDMWRMTASLLADTCPYRSRKLMFLGSIRATVGSIWVRGEKATSAYFSPRTVPVFRSESARYVIFIQMSREMWQFDTDDGGEGDGGIKGDDGGAGGVGGEIVFNKLINGFLPELFKRWRRINAHHMVSIVLFTRIVYEHGEPVGVLSGKGKESDEFLGTPGGIEIGEGRRYRDFFRVVVSSMGSADWTVILHKLKREFAVFLQDVLVQPVDDDDNTYPDPTPPLSSSTSFASRPNTPAIGPIDKKLRPRTHSASTNSHPSPRLPPTKPLEQPKPRKTIITGRPSAAIHGNILEAINLATIQFSRDHIDRDLVRTGISVILVTPGTGHFEVDYEMLRSTTEALITNGLGIDLVCLSKVPLHSVPLFRYRNPVVASTERTDEVARNPNLSPPKQTAPVPGPGEWVYCQPHWIDISFWSTASEKKTRRLQGTNGQVVKRNDSKPTKRKDLGFRARCKMYELQMMGVVENETTCISVPFLHENPLWQALPNENYPRRHQKEGDKDIEKRREAYAQNFQWMDDHDDLAFRPLQDLQDGLKKAESRNIDGDGHENLQKILDEEDPLVLGTSYHDRASIRTKNSDRGFFDRSMKERNADMRSSTELTPPAASGSVAGSSSNSGGLLARPSRLARQLSYGFKIGNWGAPKAIAKTAAVADVGVGTMSTGTMSTGMGAGGVKITRGFDTGDPSSPRSPLSPRGSKEMGRIDESPEKFSWPSQPISITGKSFDAARKEKDRRRTAVGSPLDGRGPGAQGREVDILKQGPSLRPPGARNPMVIDAEKTTAIPLTVSPTSALAPWVQVLNPSKPKKNQHSVVSQYRRWHKIFPRPVSAGTVKWKSLCSPAALPLTTEHFPTAEQLANEYQENPYVISQNEPDYDMTEASTANREELVRAMIALRLAQGFQIVVGERAAEAMGARGSDLDVFNKNYMVRAGASCFMSRGSQIHQLICDEEYNVEVKRYVRKPTTAITAFVSGKSDEYTSYIKSIMKDTYIPVKASFRQNIGDYNWNRADQYIGGYDEDLGIEKEKLRYWRVRFVLIPNDPPENARRGQARGAELNDEEIRLEGLRRLTMIFQRTRYIPPEERHFERFGRQRNKEKNPLQIVYKTVDPSVAVAQELETLSFPDTDGQMRRSQLLTTETFERKNLDIKAIAQELQGPRGVRLQDRRWHLKLHSNCFIGEEMVTWIVENFKDVTTRQEAEEVGLELFQKGLFQHVDKRHEFRDGNYFFRIAETYTNPARPSSKGGWFGTFKSDKSVPPTPLSDSSSPMHRARSRSSTVLTDDSMSEGAKTPTNPSAPQGSAATGATMTPKKKVEIELTKAMKLDVDSGKKSYRPEVITLHYDRLHNPDNCYHLRVEWMNTTTKLIEDCVTSWARSIDRYGLKLVEAPIDEIAALPTSNLFRAPVHIKLALLPPPPPIPLAPSSASLNTTPVIENMEMSTILSPLSPATPTSPMIHPTPPTVAVPDQYFFHKAILKRFGFVLDTEAASLFPQEIKVKLSFAPFRPSYRYSQYIHRSGVLFAQVTDQGEFLLVANRAYNLRVGSNAREPSHATFSSPHYSSNTHPPLSNNADRSPEELKEEFGAFCTDEEALRKFYDDLTRPFLPHRAPIVSHVWEGSPVLHGVGSPTVAPSEVNVGRASTVSIAGSIGGSVGGSGSGSARSRMEAEMADVSDEFELR